VSKEDKFEKPPVPAYLMSFGDMMTLILTFFILLVSMASEQRAGFVAAGTGSFVQAINSLGLPGLMKSGKKPIALGERQAHYMPSREKAESPIMQAAPAEKRIIESVENRMRDDFAVQLARGDEVAIPSAIDFLPGTRTLTPESKRFLNGVIQIANNNACDIIIESHVRPVEDEGHKKSYARSTERGMVAAEYLHRVGGIPRARITAIGYGSFRPIVKNGRSRRRGGLSNQRINIIFAKPAYTKPIGA